MYTFILSPIEGDSTMQGKIMLGQHPTIKSGDIASSFNIEGCLNQIISEFKEWANTNCPLGGFITPENIEYTLDYLNSEMLAYEQIHKDQNDLGAEIVIKLYKELFIESLFKIFPPQEGDNWLAIDLNGRISYHNRKPIKNIRGYDPAYNRPAVGCWVTWEHNRNVGKVGFSVINWENHLYKIGAYPEKPYNP